MTDNAKIINQLRALVLLTQTEEQIARTRISQARTEAVRRELTENADNASKRTKLIAEQLREMGGVPDVVTPVIGRLGAILKATFEQATPLEEALLSDLQLEHQLADRATYLKVLAEKTENTKLRNLAEGLIKAHAATVEWLTVVLAEEGLGGPAALQPTPLQRVAAGAAQAAGTPFRVVGNRVNEVIDAAQQRREQAGERLSDVANKASAFTGAVRETLTVGRSAALRRAERIAGREGNRNAQDKAHTAREELGDVSADELPIKGYDSMNQQEAIKSIKGLTAVHDLNVVIRYEETHKDRTGVVNAAQTHMAELAKEAVGISAE